MENDYWRSGWPLSEVPAEIKKLINRRESLWQLGAGWCYTALSVLDDQRIQPGL
jgi:hypothetical protein